MKRSPWYYSGLILLSFIIISAAAVSFGPFYYEYREDKAYEEKQEEIDGNEAKRDAHIASATSIPTYKSDSIAYRIMTDFDFSQWNINPKELGYLTKQKDKKLLTVINFQNAATVPTIDVLRMMNALDDFVFEQYAYQLPAAYLVIAVEGKSRYILRPSEYIYKGTDEEYYLQPFYEDKEGSEIDMTQLEGDAKKRALLRQVRENIRTSQLDSVKLTQKWNQMRKKFDFNFFQEPVKISDRTKENFLYFEGYEYPRELELLAFLHNGEGPFVATQSLGGSIDFRDQNYEDMVNDKIKDKEGKMMPLETMHFWTCIYNDDTYRYYIDFCPGPNGEYGQIFTFDENDNLKVIAKNLIEFVDLFIKKKIPVDLEMWLK